MSTSKLLQQFHEAELERSVAERGCKALRLELELERHNAVTARLFLMRSLEYVPQELAGEIRAFLSGEGSELEPEVHLQFVRPALSDAIDKLKGGSR